MYLCCQESSLTTHTNTVHSFVICLVKVKHVSHAYLTLLVDSEGSSVVDLVPTLTKQRKKQKQNNTQIQFLVVYKNNMFSYLQNFQTWI